MIETQEKFNNAALLTLVQQQQSQLQQQNSQLEKKDFQISKLQHQLEQLLRAFYGSKSERFTASADPNQIPLSLDVECISAPEVKKETITYDRNKRSTSPNHKGRMPLPDHLERKEIIIEPLEDITGLTRIGEEVTEQLEIEPGKMFVKKYVRPKYAKPQGEGVLIGDLPSFTIGKGIAGPGLLATIVIQKYLDHLPLYRQIEQFKRLGVEIPASTMSDWVAMCLDVLEPLYETLKRKILTCNYLQADETPIKVLDRNIKGKTHLGSYWVYRDPVSGLVLFDYRKSRGREGPREILESFEGFLQSDGWSAYPGFDTNKITLFHCMAHARRYFEQAKDNHAELSAYALKEIQKLYAIERRAREEKLNHDQRRELRQHEALPVLNQLHQWLKENIVKEPPASSMGKALSYSLKRWEKLMLYTGDGKLEIDNNLVENSIRPIAIGRKNYLFAGSHQAAQCAAMIYSLLGSCKLKGVEPFEWLKNIFEILPDSKANRLEELLP
mgnify:FL=1